MLVAAIAFSLLVQPLHPAFVIDGPALASAYEEGRKLGKSKIKSEKLLRQWIVDLGKVRSPEGQSWTAPEALLQTPTNAAIYSGWSDEREYIEPVDGLKKLKEFYEKPIADKDRRINIVANLLAWPGISDWDHSINRAANPDDVRDVKFVLLVDGKKALHPAASPEKMTEATFDGSVSIPEYNTIYGSSSTSGASGSSQTTSTVLYTTFDVESYSVYKAEYRLKFRLYDPETGEPYVNKDTKTLTLKVVRGNGEHSAVFQLSKFVRK